MLEAGFTFAGVGAPGLINPSSFFGNDDAIENVQINKTATGRYTVTFLSARDLKNNQPPAVNLTAQDNTGNTFILQLSPPVTFIYNPNAVEYKWTLQMQITSKIVAPSFNIASTPFSFTILTFGDPQLVMVNINAANTLKKNPYAGQPVANRL